MPQVFDLFPVDYSADRNLSQKLSVARLNAYICGQASETSWVLGIPMS